VKRDLPFAVSRLIAMLDERKFAALIRQRDTGKPKDSETPAKSAGGVSALRPGEANWAVNPGGVLRGELGYLRSL
jgi:hypothetical protein